MRAPRDLNGAHAKHGPHNGLKGGYTCSLYISISISIYTNIHINI